MSASRMPYQPRRYRLFLGSVASWFGAIGMQTVLVAWLVLGELHLAATSQGLAQMALVLPSVIFILIGGALADRIDRHRVLLALHGSSGAATGLLALIVATGRASFPIVLGYAALMGTLNAFAFPARDALLSEVAGTNLMRAVSGATLLQFGAQFLGSQLAGAATHIGTGMALLCQGLIATSGVAAALQLARSQVAPEGAGATTATAPRRALRLPELTAGLREVLASPHMAPVMALSAAIGLFFVGPYVVAFPVLVKEVYGGGVAEIGQLQGMFPLGTIAGALFLLWRGQVETMGRPLMAGLAGAGSCLLVISLGLPFLAMLGLALIWGICGGIFITLSRTIFQVSASAENRGRVLSVYTFSFMGAGGLASPLIGLATDAFGPLRTCAACGALMLIFCAIVCCTTPILTARPGRPAQDRPDERMAPERERHTGT